MKDVWVRRTRGHRYVLIVADCGHHVWEKMLFDDPDIRVPTTCCPCVDPTERIHDTEVAWLEWSLPG